MQARSKVWPVGAVTGSYSKDLQIGHLNSSGGSCTNLGVLDGRWERPKEPAGDLPETKFKIGFKLPTIVCVLFEIKALPADSKENFWHGFQLCTILGLLQETETFLRILKFERKEIFCNKSCSYGK